MKRIFFTIKIFIVVSTFFSLKAQNYITIQGRALENTTQKGVSYAHINLANTNIGTLTNEQGYFSLQILPQHKDKKVFISCIGYESENIPLPNDVTSLWVIALKPAQITLREITLNPLNPVDIFAKFLKKYQAQEKPEALKIQTFLRGYLTSSILPYQLNKSTSVYESNISFTLYEYNRNKPYDNTIQINKDIYEEIKDLHIFDGLYPINISANNIFIPNFSYLIWIAYMRKHAFFDTKNLKKYIFELDTIYTQNNTSTYKISFRYKNVNNKIKLGKGSIWIQDSTYQIQKLVFDRHFQDTRTEVLSDKMNINDNYTYEIIYSDGKPIYVSYAGNNKKINKNDSTHIIRKNNKAEMFIFNQTFVKYDSIKHQSIDYEDINYFGLSENEKFNEYGYPHIPSQDWEGKFTKLRTIAIKDNISYILSKAGQKACEVQNGNYDIRYTGNRLMHNHDLDGSSRERKYCNFKGSCIFERTLYGLGGAKFVTKGNQFTVVHLGKETWVAPDSTQILRKINIVEDRKIEFTHFNEMIFPPLLKPAIYFNEFYEATKVAKTELLPTESYEETPCYKIAITYLGNQSNYVLQEKQILWIRKTDYMPVKLEWHIDKTKTKRHPAHTDIRVFSISNLQFNETNFAQKFKEATNLNNYKVNTEPIRKKHSFDELVEKGYIPKRFANKMQKKKEQIEKRLYRKKR
jgi:hypothetical protein